MIIMMIMVVLVITPISRIRNYSCLKFRSFRFLFRLFLITG